MRAGGLSEGWTRLEVFPHEDTTGRALSESSVGDPNSPATEIPRDRHGSRQGHAPGRDLFSGRQKSSERVVTLLCPFGLFVPPSVSRPTSPHPNVGVSPGPTVGPHPRL